MWNCSLDTLAPSTQGTCPPSFQSVPSFPVSALKLPPDLAIVAALASNKQMGDASLPSSPSSLSLPAQTLPVSLPASLGSFTISASESASFAVINSASDANVDGYFDLDRARSSAAQDPTQAPLLEAPITFDPAKAYLVLTALSATGKVSDQLTVGSNAAMGLQGNLAPNVGGDVHGV